MSRDTVTIAVCDVRGDHVIEVGDSIVYWPPEGEPRTYDSLERCIEAESLSLRPTGDPDDPVEATC